VYKIILMSAAIALFAACSTVSVDTDYDKTADFSKYRTFDWAPVAAMRIDGRFNQLTDQRVRAAVTDALSAKGIERAPGKPQLLVAFHTGARERTEVVNTGWSGGYGGGYGYWPGYGQSSVQTYNYTEGTLMVDLVDADQKQLVWRGKAVCVVGDYDSQESRIREAVMEMFKKYPPAVK